MLYTEVREGNTLRQRFLWQQQILTIEEEWLTIEEKSPFATENVAVAYEEMGGYVVRRRWHSKKSIAAAVGLLLIAGMLILAKPGDAESFQAAFFYGVPGAIILCFYLLTYKNLIGLSYPDNTSSESLKPVFFCPLFVSSTPVIDTFIQELLTKRNNYLRERYTDLTPLIDYDVQLSQLNVLSRAGAINHREFLALREKLNSLFKQNQSSIGFQKPPVNN